jgi:hypothetical protein
MRWTIQQLHVKKLVALLKLLRGSAQLSPHYKQLITKTLEEIGKD